jgi:hypothetical protein
LGFVSGKKQKDKRGLGRENAKKRLKRKKTVEAEADGWKRNE